MSFEIKRLFINPYTISLLAVILIIIALLWGSLSWLDTYTRHGEEIEVPNLSDMTLSEAEATLSEKGLRYSVADSTYIRGKKLGVVVEQIPSVGSKVKTGRTIYLITNANTIRTIALPDVREVSLRQAESIIQSIGFRVDSIVYVASEYKDLVKDVKLGDKILAPGSKIAEGSALTLLVGKGDSSEEIIVPSLRSLSAEQAISKAHTAYLNIGEIYYDVQPKDEKDKDSYFVYKQTPITGTRVDFGGTINIYMTKDPTTLETPEEVKATETEEVATEEKDDLWK